MDVIPIVSKLNLFFQKEFTDIAMVKVQIDHTLKDLGQLREYEGTFQQQLKKDIQGHTLHYKELTITRCPEKDIISVKQKFISNLIANKEKRFPDTELISAFGILSMRPIGLISGEELESWGNEQLDVILDHF
ncbi:uncharacterized protein LOC132555845 [Ylistrum balloti]|uniref:uncharacterized protein LOC132555845 n=1 Tax=Ylistrum balloti TaxID=509963 RepID=UPI002905801B|nr:uncharacterized protein LOC132555845 [Ylistrum balloti]